MQHVLVRPPRIVAIVLVASALCVGPLTAQTHAVPPAAAAGGLLNTPALGERWLEHRVAPGERIAEIADLYGVGSDDVLAWNKLDKDRPMIRTGQMLRIRTSAPSQSRTRASYTVRRGDSWSTLAKRFEVSVGRLRDQWNSGEQELQLGTRIVVFRLPDPNAEAQAEAEQLVAAAAPAPAASIAPTATVAASPAPAAAVKVAPVSVAPIIPPIQGARSHGRPDRGRILDAAQIPINEGLYSIRRPDHSWGASFTIEQLTLAMQRFRATGFDREIVIQDMSRKGGGRFRPHESHQSGRDVDIRLPLKAGVPVGTIPEATSVVDWDATWILFLSMLSTQQVRFIFLSRTRQKPLYEAALRAGATKEELSTLMQYPRTSRTAVIRHSRGHNKHFHVRFNCGPADTTCVD
jgi:murein endopeptidase